MSHRPYPNADRALAHLERRPDPVVCPACGHEAHLHATANGATTCTPGPPSSCSQCEENWHNASWLRNMTLLGRVLNYLPTYVVFTGRRAGKTAALHDVERQALDRGEHVHRASAVDGEHCLSGMPKCRVPKVTPPPDRDEASSPLDPNLLDLSERTRHE